MSELVNIAIFVLRILVPLLLFTGLAFMKKGKKGPKGARLGLVAKKEWENNGIFDYEDVDEYLKKTGAYAMFGESFTPPVFISIRFLMAGLFFTIFQMLPVAGKMMEISPWLLYGASVAIAIIGFRLPELFLNMSNSQDNDNMTIDINNMFECLKFQTRAGIHISQSLYECYRTVRNKRLKKELLAAANTATMRNDVITAVTELNARFENEFIDTFCLMILQMQESGYSLQILDDMTKQVEDTLSAMNLKERQRMERKIQFAELGIFAGLVGLCLVGMALQLTGTVSGFF